MRRHNIFTLGIILSCIYGINAMAWPTITATDVWTNSGHTTPATKRCGDCCKNDCWLPNGTYYDIKGTFTETCTGEPSEPTCISGRTYSVVDGQCKFQKLSCPSGQYDIGFSSCINADTYGSGYGFWDFSGRTGSTDTYDLTGPGQWGVTFSYGKVTGIASCNSTGGNYGVATTTNFNNTSNGECCWCKMTGPAASRWVFSGIYNSADYCANGCAANCVDSFRSSAVRAPAFRSGVFGSVE